MANAVPLPHATVAILHPTIAECSTGMVSEAARGFMAEDAGGERSSLAFRDDRQFSRQAGLRGEVG
jgi:hypothetical protein